MQVIQQRGWPNGTRRAETLTSSYHRSIYDTTHSKSRHRFSVSSILARALLSIATKCWETHLCTDERDFLWSMLRREGTWDSKGSSTIASAVIAHEETNSLVPEHKRLQATKTPFKLHRRQQKLRILTATMGSGDIGFVGSSIGSFLVSRSSGQPGALGSGSAAHVHIRHLRQRSQWYQGNVEFRNTKRNQYVCTIQIMGFL